MTVTDESTLLAALHADPCDYVAWLALADWMEENGLSREAELLRLQQWLTEHLDDEHRPLRELRQRMLLASGVMPRGPQLTLPLSDRVTMTLSLIPAGEFYMGRTQKPSARGDEGPRHKV